MYQISEESKKKVYASFNRTEKMVKDDVEIVKSWMQSQPHLPELMDDVKIKNFLQLNKFSIEKTKQKIDMYYTIRGLLPSLFAESNPKSESLQKALAQICFCTHPYALDGIHRVYFIRMSQPDTYCPVELTKIFFATFEVRLYEDFMVDDVVVFDLNHVSLGDLRKLTLDLVNKATTVYQKVFSLRLRGMYLLNSPSYVSTLMTILKAVLKPKIFERVQVCQDDKILNDIFPKEQLPKEYGGNGPSLRELTNMTNQKLKEYQSRFDLLDTLRTDESKRPEKLNNDEVLGFHGNFKKLDVD